MPSTPPPLPADNTPSEQAQPVGETVKKPGVPGNRPIHEDGEIAVFLKTVPSRDPASPPNEFYNVAVGPRGNRTYFEAFTSLFKGGPRVEPDELVDLYRGRTLQFDFPSTDKPGETYPVAVGALITSRSTPSKQAGQPAFVSNRLEFVTGTALRNEPEGPVSAFLIQEKDERGADKLKFWRTCGPKSDPIQLELADCFRLRNGETLDDGVRQARMEGVSEKKVGDKTYKTADVRVAYIAQKPPAAAHQGPSRRAL